MAITELGKRKVGASYAVLMSVLAFVAVAGWSKPAAADSTAEVKSRGYISVATEDDFRPFEFVDNGIPTGYDNELLGLVRQKLMPLEIKQQIMPFTGILPGVTTGKFDMALTAILVTPARKGTFDFTIPLAESTTYYATKKGSDIKSAADLAGKVVGAQAGSAMLADLKAFNDTLIAKGKGIKQIIEYQSYPEAYQDLGIGRIDAVVNTQINLGSLIATKADVFAMGQAVGKPVYIAWAVKKGNPGALELINAALTDLRKSGQMYALQKKWFGASFEKMPMSVN